MSHRCSYRKLQTSPPFGIIALVSRCHFSQVMMCVLFYFIYFFYDGGTIVIRVQFTHNIYPSTYLGEKRQNNCLEVTFISGECWTELCFLNATLLPITKKSPFFSSDESEEEEDHRKKFKIKIKPLLADRVVAAPTVDELKASIGNISLSPSPVVSHPDITGLAPPAFIRSHLCVPFPLFKSVALFITTFTKLHWFVFVHSSVAVCDILCVRCHFSMCTYLVAGCNIDLSDAAQLMSPNSSTHSSSTMWN